MLTESEFSMTRDDVRKLTDTARQSWAAYPAIQDAYGSILSVIQDMASSGGSSLLFVTESVAREHQLNAAMVESVFERFRADQFGVTHFQGVNSQAESWDYWVVAW